MSQPSGETLGRRRGRRAARVADGDRPEGDPYAFAVDDLPTGARHHRLLPCERAIFGAVLRKGMRILDLGASPEASVAVLSTKALEHRRGVYRGMASGPASLRACRQAYPELQFDEGDGADLSIYASGQFDAVVFARNGIANLEPDDQRVACEQEIYRVLRTGGVAVLSMINPQAVVEPPSGWRTASRTRRARLFMGSAGDMLRSTGEGWRDGRLRTPHLYLDSCGATGPARYQARPSAFLAEVEAIGFRQLGPLVASDHPHPFQRFVSPWYYVAVRKF